MEVMEEERGLRALELLTEYNRADTVNLVNVAEETYDRLVRQHGF